MATKEELQAAADKKAVEDAAAAKKAADDKEAADRADAERLAREAAAKPKLVKMVRAYPDECAGPKTADVHPDEVNNWLGAGWIAAK